MVSHFLSRERERERELAWKLYTLSCKAGLYLLLQSLKRLLHVFITFLFATLRQSQIIGVGGRLLYSFTLFSLCFLCCVIYCDVENRNKVLCNIAPVLKWRHVRWASPLDADWLRRASTKWTSTKLVITNAFDNCSKRSGSIIESFCVLKITRDD